MLKFILTLALFTGLSSSAYATTAVLCGDPAKVDANNKLASVWLIFDNEDSRSPDEIRAILKGTEASVLKTHTQSGLLSLELENPEITLVVKEKNIENAFCDGESLFSIQVVSPSHTQTARNCRCFSD